MTIAGGQSRLTTFEIYKLMVTRLFEEPIEAVESSDHAQVPIATRLFYCIGASMVAIIPSVATTYS
ncbi:MAG TPA: hypothetical protein VFX63_10000, partial [Pyrinomonadaceae bacterium]|nr:hypothetical protein [Pyrinomonadaceae bacterium]